MMLRLLLHLITACSALHAAASLAATEGGSIRFDVAAVPGVQKYLQLLEQPGYLAVVLENNGLAPSQSSKLEVGNQGRSAVIRGARLQFVAKKGSVYSYEASYSLGLGDSKLAIPVMVDITGLPDGRVTVALDPPLASLIPNELIDRVRLKIQLVANANAQRKVLDYLEAKSKEGNLVEMVLLDAYNQGGGPAGGRDVGGAVPLSDQWLLILTLVIWLIVVPVFLLVYRLRQRRGKPA